MAMNLASKFSDKVDEKFTVSSFADSVVGNAYDFNGVKSINVYSVPSVAMVDYNRTGATNRYGTPVNLQASVQKMELSKDRGFSFLIDRGDLIQSQRVLEANKALNRQINEKWIPEYDTYVFQTLASKASALGNLSTTTPSKSNAYSLFMAGQEFLGNHMAPDTGRVAICSYGFAGLLMQDNAFVRYGDASQQMIRSGVIGEIDGVTIKRVPSNRLPNGCACIITHPYASIAPKQLYEYKIHDNPPGYSGYLVEGRMIYDCFVLDNKANGIYYIGGSGVMRTLDVDTMPSVTSGKTAVVVNPAKDSGNKWYYETKANASSLTSVAFGTAITPASWTELTSSGMEITPTSSHTVIQVVEVDGDNKPVGRGIAKLHIG